MHITLYALNVTDNMIYFYNIIYLTYLLSKITKDSSLSLSLSFLIRLKFMDNKLIFVF